MVLSFYLPYLVNIITDNWNTKAIRSDKARYLMYFKTYPITEWDDEKNVIQ